MKIVVFIKATEEYMPLAFVCPCPYRHRQTSVEAGVAQWCGIISINNEIAD